MTRAFFRDWTETYFAEVKVGVVVQHSKSLRYALVVDEPTHETVTVQNSEGRQVWQLEHLSYWRLPKNRVAIFQTVDRG